MKIVIWEDLWKVKVNTVWYCRYDIFYLGDNDIDIMTPTSNIGDDDDNESGSKDNASTDDKEVNGTIGTILLPHVPWFSFSWWLEPYYMCQGNTPISEVPDTHPNLHLTLIDTHPYNHPFYLAPTTTMIIARAPCRRVIQPTWGQDDLTKRTNCSS